LIGSVPTPSVALPYQYQPGIELAALRLILIFDTRNRSFRVGTNKRIVSGGAPSPRLERNTLRYFTS
jgi:hypothetical protein